jgi:hypothetical protein
MNKLSAFLRRLSEEPPFRLFTKAVIKRFPVSIRVKSRWDVVSRPQYLAGVLAAADEAIRDGVKEISVFEFGVAGGNGLLALADLAELVEVETGVKIAVYGFDAGAGLPEFAGDYRDYPDRWRSGDYPMDEAALRRRLKPNTTLVIGNISKTVPEYMPRILEPIGFVSVDVDIYSSTRDLLKMFTLPNKKMLKRVYMYFDDIDLPFTHKFAGELLALNEFNASNAKVKIDRWRSVDKQRPFPESAWLKRMYISHDLNAISNASVTRKVAVISVDQATGNTG